MGRSLTPTQAEACGFAFVKRSRFAHEVRFRRADLAGYLVSLSNVVDAMQSGREDAGQAEHWLNSALAALFSCSTGAFQFGGPIWYLERR